MEDLNLTSRWSEILTHLGKSGLDFLVVGGAAIVLHGIPRTTLDVDIFISSDDQNVHRIFTLLTRDLGLRPRDPAIMRLASFPHLVIGQWLTFAAADGPDMIDVFVCRAGEFNRLIQRAEMVRIGDAEVPVAGIDLLKEMKRRSGRPIDLADIALIEECEALEREEEQTGSS